MTRIVVLVLTLISTCVALAEPQPLRVSVQAQAEGGLTGKLVSLMSRELRKLDSVTVTDQAPQFVLTCTLVVIDQPGRAQQGYAASLAVTTGDRYLLTHLVQVDNTLESLSHELILAVDGSVFEKARRAQSQ